MRKKNRIIFITVVVVATAITIAAAISLVKVVSNLTKSEEEGGIMNDNNDNTNNTNSTNNVENDDDDDEFYYNPHKHEGNSTLSATFTIHVTPEHYHILSWSILWGCFVVSVLFGVYQIQLEKKWLKYVTTTSKKSSHCPSSRRSNSKSPSGNHTSASGGAMIDPETGLSIRGGNHNTSSNNSNRPSSSRRIIRASSRAGMGGSGRMILSASAASFNSSSNPGNLGDEQAVSSGDISRATFRRLLLLAMTSRTIAMPIQIYSDPLWIQLIADTFPVMVYATAWTWLVSFFVQLVGVALGTSTNIHVTTTTSTPNQNNQAGGTSISNGSLNRNSNNNNNNNSNAGAGASPYNNNNNNSPVATIGTVIQITSYTIYVLLIITFSVFRRIAAAVLLYALLCCVYATLLGTGLYFCPRLLGLLLPGLVGAGNGGGVGGESERAATEGEGDAHERGEAQEGKQQERSQRTKQQQQNSALALRLCVCTSVCLLVFAARTFCFARKVVQSTAPPSMQQHQHSTTANWWFVYGTLELLPGILFLIMLHPKKVVVASTSPSGSDSNINSNRNNDSGNGNGDNKNNHSRSDSNINNNNDPDQPPTASSGGGRRTPPLHSYLKRSESDTSASASALVGSTSRVSGSLGLVQPLLSSPSPSPVLGGGGSVATYSEISPLLATTTTTYSKDNSNNNIHHQEQQIR